ncbi:hypothetical protein GS534_24280 [Rhodococcus hoagii]|nr:hypothetical protein [Prescottella equi]NKS33148.1 hypothetical protein [Prescottella equi]
MTEYNPNQPHYYAPQPQPKKSHTGRNIAIGVAVVAVLGFGGCAALVAGTANEISNTINSSTAATTPGSGIQKVGTDIQPGEYRWKATGYAPYYARLSCLTGELECILANNVPEEGSTGYLTIEPGDVAIETRDLELTPQ